jgi:hypothetical protein
VQKSYPEHQQSQTADLVLAEPVRSTMDVTAQMPIQRRAQLARNIYEINLASLYLLLAYVYIIADASLNTKPSSDGTVL